MLGAPLARMTLAARDDRTDATRHPGRASRRAGSGGELRALAFADAESAKRWAHALPLTSVALVCETVHGQLKALAAADFPAARARDDRRGAARSRRPPAHGARAPLRGQGAAGGGSRARGGRAGDRAVAGAVGAVLGVPQAAARGRSRARRASSPRSCSAGCTSASSSCWCTASRAARCRRRCGTSCTRTTGWPKCSNARSPRSPTTCCPTPSASPAIRRTATRCCSGSPIPARCR